MIVTNRDCGGGRQSGLYLLSYVKDLYSRSR